MSFYQNPFTQEFKGTWALGDRKFSMNFPLGGKFYNSGRGNDLVIAWGNGPYNLTGNDGDGNAKSTLNIQFALDAENFKNWGTLSLTNIAAGAVSASAAKAKEIANALNNNTAFASYFVAGVQNVASNASYVGPDSPAPVDNTIDRLFIRQKLPVERMRFYIANGQAESVLQFNARAGVAQLPSYFDRHTVTNRFRYEDSTNMLILLDMAKVVDQNVVDNAVDIKGNSLGFKHGDTNLPTGPGKDYQFLKGRAGDFVFRKITAGAGSTVELRYNAGAGVGDLAKKITYTPDMSTPTSITEEPYILASGDILTP